MVVSLSGASCELSAFAMSTLPFKWVVRWIFRTFVQEEEASDDIDSISPNSGGNTQHLTVLSNVAYRLQKVARTMPMVHRCLGGWGPCLQIE